MSTQPCGHPESESNDRLVDAAWAAAEDYLPPEVIESDTAREHLCDIILRHIQPVFEQAVRDERERCAVLRNELKVMMRSWEEERSKP